MRELFIYYRVGLDHAAAATAEVAAMHARLRERLPGLTTRLLRRDDGAGERVQTWMETYAFDDAMLHPAGITPEIESLIDAQARALAGWIDGERHVEAFVASAASCAS